MLKLQAKHGMAKRPNASKPQACAQLSKYTPLRVNQQLRLPSRQPLRVVPQAFLAAGPVDTVSNFANHLNPVLEVSEGLETPIQLIYLLTLLGFLAGGAYLVARQVLIRRELDESAKALGERIRTGEATCEDYYELGVVLTRKKLFTQATKNLEKSKKLWDGDESELAQVHNALGYCYSQMDRLELAIPEFKRAVELQPGYVTAWNNLGDAYEKAKEWRQALAAYKEVLTYAPNNKVAEEHSRICREKIERMTTTTL